MLEKDHADGKCLFEASSFDVPEEEQWLYDMANSKGVGLMHLTSPSGKTLLFTIFLDKFSSTRSAGTPYVEFSLKGVHVGQK